MKILAACVLRWNSDTEEPVILDGAYNLDDCSFFTRGVVKEYLVFASKLLMKRVPVGIQAIDLEGNLIYSCVQPDGLGVLITTDKDYKQRVAIAMAKELIGAFCAAHPAATWRVCARDGGCKLPKLEAALRDWQDPTNVDKVQAQLVETEEVAVQAIEKVLQRGEKLDDLLENWHRGELYQQRGFYRKAAMMHISSGFVTRAQAACRWLLGGQPEQPLAEPSPPAEPLPARTRISSGLTCAKVVYAAGSCCCCCCCCCRGPSAAMMHESSGFEGRRSAGFEKPRSGAMMHESSGFEKRQAR
jgi:synaptobrevin family protein YKT6